VLEGFPRARTRVLCVLLQASNVVAGIRQTSFEDQIEKCALFSHIRALIGRKLILPCDHLNICDHIRADVASASHGLYIAKVCKCNGAVKNVSSTYTLMDFSMSLVST